MSVPLERHFSSYRKIHSYIPNRNIFQFFLFVILKIFTSIFLSFIQVSSKSSHTLSRAIFFYFLKCSTYRYVMATVIRSCCKHFTIWKSLFIFFFRKLKKYSACLSFFDKLRFYSS